MLGPPLRFVERTKVVCDGRTLLFFGGNDYHRLSNHPAVIEAFCDAARREGLSSAGSRTTTGNHPHYGDLERAVARFLGVEDAVVFSSGYLGNLVLLQAVASDFDRFFIDAVAHSSVTDAAAILPRDRLHTFDHFDPAGLAETLGSHLGPGERPLVLTDGIFPSTGEMAPLAAYRPLLESTRGAILVDDAHGVAVVGPTGKGTAEACGLPPGVALSTGTLSKGFGTFGGFVAGTSELAEKIRARSLAFIGSTGMTVPLAAAGVRAIEILETNPPMISSLRIRVARVRDAARALGFSMPDSPAPIVSIRFPD
ncbi:MAG: pyridoxal phosphate-dependent aminotransferase family protein, partial [Planctomycetes bacterium]|nr:pyridoxal phosphate-dependent aminotransferase family protein [Planctomycetota bacterium]